MGPAVGFEADAISVEVIPLLDEESKDARPQS